MKIGRIYLNVILASFFMLFQDLVLTVVKNIFLNRGIILTHKADRRQDRQSKSRPPSQWIEIPTCGLSLLNKVPMPFNPTAFVK